MTTRHTSYRIRPSDTFIDTLSRLQENKLFLVARNGPTVFSIKDEQNKIYKVLLSLLLSSLLSSLLSLLTSSLISSLLFTINVHYQCSLSMFIIIIIIMILI